VTLRRAEDGGVEVVREWLSANEIEADEDELETGEVRFSFALPGTNKLQTPVRLDLGRHALGIHAFVCRRPDENFEAVHRFLLEQNMRLFGVAYGLDSDGDIYLDARLPLSSVNLEDLDRLLGSVLTYADETFNVLLELGFATSIRKEWAWREARGESTANLEAFRHLRS
jgi:hypothetical protein